MTVNFYSLFRAFLSFSITPFLHPFSLVELKNVMGEGRGRNLPLFSPDAWWCLLYFFSPLKNGFWTFFISQPHHHLFNVLSLSKNTSHFIFSCLIVLTKEKNVFGMFLTWSLACRQILITRCMFRLVILVLPVSFYLADDVFENISIPLCINGV